jgi:hypothetical protein
MYPEVPFVEIVGTTGLRAKQHAGECPMVWREEHARYILLTL